MKLGEKNCWNCMLLLLFAAVFCWTLVQPSGGWSGWWSGCCIIRIASIGHELNSRQGIRRMIRMMHIIRVHHPDLCWTLGRVSGGWSGWCASSGYIIRFCWNPFKNSFQLRSFPNQFHFFSTFKCLLWLLSNPKFKLRDLEKFYKKLFSIIFLEFRLLWPLLITSLTSGRPTGAGRYNYGIRAWV